MNETLENRLQRLDCSINDHWECYCALILWICIPPVFLVIGTCGNAINIIVLTRKSLRKYSTSVFLLVLSFSDATCLWTSLLRHTILRLFNRDLKNASSFNCMFTHWFSFTAAGVSSWLITCLTLERTIMVRCPTFSHNHFTRRKACIVSLGIVAVSSLLCGHLLFGFYLTQQHNGNDDYECIYVSPGYYDFRQIYWSVFVLVFLNVIPLFVIAVGNVLIACSLCRRNQIIPASISQTDKARKTRAAAKMLCFLTSFFLSTSLPYTIFAVLISDLPADIDSKMLSRLKLVQGITLTLLFSNFTFNFLFYFRFGELYQKEWKEIVREVRSRLNRLKQRREPPRGEIKPTVITTVL